MIRCVECDHPDTEHVDGTGACKVKTCECKGFVAPEGPPANVAKYTVIARATNDDGSQGLEIGVAAQEGLPNEISQEDVNRYADRIRQMYTESFGEAPIHVGVVTLPYLASIDGDEDHPPTFPNPQGTPEMPPPSLN